MKTIQAENLNLDFFLAEAKDFLEAGEDMLIKAPKPNPITNEEKAAAANFVDSLEENY